MNELNYATLPASKRLVEAGIWLKTDFYWASVDMENWSLCTIPHKVGFKEYPAPSMAEVWRELPRGRRLAMQMTERAKINKCIDDFAEAMKTRMHEKLLAGYFGWDEYEYPHRLLLKAADAAINSNPKSAVDCANFCMMTWLRRNRK